MAITLDGTLNQISVTNGVPNITLDSTGRVTTPNKPHAICKMVAGNSGSQTALGNPSTLIPTNVLKIVGSVYNSSNGYFTAPVTGLYEINFHSDVYTASASGWIRVRNYINGTLYTDHYSDKVASTWQYMMTHDLMYLNVGDYVYLVLDTSSGTIGADYNNYTLISFALQG